ncbi:MAG: SdrD B-like domain-containing protein [Planctomycetota bacterium]
MLTRILSASVALAAAASLSAQGCALNVHPIHIVDSQGAQFPTEPGVFGDPVALQGSEDIFLAFDPTTPSGTYYVHVTAAGGTEPEVVSLNDPMDRFVEVTNSMGVITLQLPFSTNPAAVDFGVGVNGIGESLNVGPVRNTDFSNCEFKVQFGDYWDLSQGPEWPFLIRIGSNPASGSCSVFSFHDVKIGDGSGSDVGGIVFDDDNRNGIRDAGEAPIVGQEVLLVAPGQQLSAVTDGNGRYEFMDVGKNDWAVELVVPSGFVATTPSSVSLPVCDCANVEASPIGLDEEVLACSAKPLRYWRSWNGVCEAQSSGVLPTLPALSIVNTWGCYVAPCSKWQLKWYLRCANSWNMAYSLSAQLVAMHANVLSGRVDPNCVICDPCLGVMTVADLMATSVASLQCNRYTPPCSGQARRDQRKLRNALWRANKNRIWQ